MNSSNRLMLVVFCFIVASLSIFVVSLNDTKAKPQKISPAVQEQHEKIKNELREIPAGTFLRQSNNSLFYVNWSNDDQAPLLVQISPEGSSTLLSVNALSKSTTKIIRPTDPEWCETAKEFWIPKQNKETAHGKSDL